MLKRFVQIFGGDPNKRDIDRYSDFVDQINDLEFEFEKLSDAQLKEKTTEFRRRIADGESLDEIMPEAFAVVREASKRTIGLRHFDVQLIGGAVMHTGKIAEMSSIHEVLALTGPFFFIAIQIDVVGSMNRQGYVILRGSFLDGEAGLFRNTYSLNPG